ncbi:hypothetical protein T05_5265 [Trichinella murrelli]|uniref:Uncharacterized protein n=1 Tax=Trichinella murrelli TaxID=144512 RepID=A0A0V0T3K6_9BILA|nr:hypothetical protein T05_5265 [Trichinella murrelli]
MDRKSRKIDLPKTTKYCTSLVIYSEYLIIMSKNFSIPKFNYRRSRIPHYNVEKLFYTKIQLSSIGINGVSDVLLPCRIPHYNVEKLFYTKIQLSSISINGVSDGLLPCVLR